MTYTDMEQYWIWLSSVEGIGPKRFYQLLSIYEDARAVWDALGAGEWPDGMKFLGRPALKALREARDEARFYRLFDGLDRLDIRCVTRVSEGYPADGSFLRRFLSNPAPKAQRFVHDPQLTCQISVLLCIMIQSWIFSF